MKILINTKSTESAEINEQLEFNGSFEIEFKIQDEIEKANNSFSVDKLAFLYYELESRKDLIVEADKELNELLKSLESEFDENVIY